MSEALTIDSFEPLINDVFTVTYDETKTLEMTLIEVKRLSTKRPTTDARLTEEDAFSLLFETTETGFYLQQAIFKVTHPKLGEQHIFLVPLGPGGGGMHYEAVFS
ncbi:MAG: hypothetical protein D6737_06545 [Chloroflexi bacterium]|nr:MAG: hypothetical protein D6737_06545 [Chloroflexota bacterium]